MITRPQTTGFAVSAFLALGLLWLLVGDDQRPDPAFADRCATLAPGDDFDETVRTMGLMGYRRGCGAHLRCSVREVPSIGPVEYGCDGEDCDLLWIQGTERCVVTMGPDLVVSAAELQDPGGAEGLP